MRPNRSTAARTAACASAGFVTSRVTASSSFDLPNAFETASLLRPVATTAWPAASAALVKSAPIPRPAPVMNQTLLLVTTAPFSTACSCLPVQRSHCALWISLAGRGAGGEHLLNAPQVLLRKLHPRSVNVLLQVLHVLGAGDGDYVVALRQNPGQRQLRRRGTLLMRDRLHLADEVQVLLEVLALETRLVAPVVVCGQVLELPEAARQE